MPPATQDQPQRAPEAGASLRRRHCRRRLSPGCTCCTAFADSASPRGSTRPVEASAAPGTGTAIPARVATSKACNIRSRSPRSSTSNGTGRRNTRRSRRFLRYANHVADRFDLRRHILFDTRVTAATFDEAAKMLAHRDRSRRQGVGQILHHGGRLPVGSQPCPVQGPRGFSRARSITPANGRMKVSISPDSASASSAPDRRRSSRSRSLPQQAVSR